VLLPLCYCRCATAALLLVQLLRYCCATAALLLRYCCTTAVYCCATAALLLRYCCATAVALLFSLRCAVCCCASLAPRRTEKAQRRGPFYLGLHVLATRYSHALKSEHGWFSVFSPPLDEQLVLSRSQRISVLLVKSLAAMALNAMVFGKDPTRVSGGVCTFL
jgi:hypothetical protein